ncbi:Ff.00g091500.m01.CDS01 [Fusarium sp. VM40]|nr:Ff.00g091500.m01.CDS01 [Fusarium sp. VM40]
MSTPVVTINLTMDPLDRLVRLHLMGTTMKKTTTENMAAAFGKGSRLIHIPYWNFVHRLMRKKPRRSEVKVNVALRHLIGGAGLHQLKDHLLSFHFNDLPDDIQDKILRIVLVLSEALVFTN